MPDLSEVELEADLARDRFARGPELRVHGREGVLHRMAEVDGEETRPGIVFREFGETSIMPTVEHAFGWCARPMRFTASTMRAAPTSASRRRRIGVGPAWASIPVTVTSYQRWPWAPVTTPTVFFSASRIGPCSMCASR